MTPNQLHAMARVVRAWSPQWAVDSPTRCLMALFHVVSDALHVAAAAETGTDDDGLSLISQTRCKNFTAWFIGIPYGGHWFVCDEHKDHVLRMQPASANAEARPISKHMDALTTYAGEKANRHRCIWNDAVHSRVPANKKDL